MRIELARVKRQAHERGWTVSELLERAGVSRNTFYTLVRKESVLPTSVLSVARTLGVTPGAFLRDEDPAERWARELWQDVEAIVHRHPEADPDNVRHTLILLQEPPIERLRRSLRRGNARAVR